MIAWIILGMTGAGLLAILFVLLTDGRYLGKRWMRWFYDRVGPAIFSARSEAAQWHSLAGSIARSVPRPGEATP